MSKLTESVLWDLENCGRSQTILGETRRSMFPGTIRDLCKEIEQLEVWLSERRDRVEELEQRLAAAERVCALVGDYQNEPYMYMEPDGILKALEAWRAIK